MGWSVVLVGSGIDRGGLDTEAACCKHPLKDARMQLKRKRKPRSRRVVRRIVYSTGYVSMVFL